MTQYRQGDVLLELVTEAPEQAQQIKCETIVLAEGEATGHAHTMVLDAPEDAALLDFNGDRFLAVYNKAKLAHQEHATIEIAPGTYRVTRQREWTDAEEPIQVAD